MPPLTILSDENVADILENLTIEDVKGFQESLRQALHEYSTGTQDQGACASHQPERTSVVSAQGVTSLFMPSVSSSGLGIKVVSLNTSPSTPDNPTDTTPHGAITLMNPQGIPHAFINASQLTAFRTALTSSLLITRRHAPKTLLIFGSGNQAYWHLRLSLLIHGPTLRSIHIIVRSLSPKTAWLMKTLHAIPYAQKSGEGWQDVKITMLSPAYGEYARLIKEQLRDADIIFCTTPSREVLFDAEILCSKEGRKKGRLLVAVGSYTPEMIEVPLEVVRQAVKESHRHHHHKHAQEGGVVVVDSLRGCLREAGEVVQAGLEAHQLVELGELVMLESLGLGVGSGSGSGSERDIRDSFDDLDLDSRKSIGSINGSETPPTRPTPLSTPTRSSFSSSTTLNTLSSFTSFSKASKKESSKSNRKSTSTNDDKLCRWLRDGNVVYKSVGMGLMDLVVAEAVVGLARRKGVGTVVEGF